MTDEPDQQMLRIDGYALLAYVVFVLVFAAYVTYRWHA